MGIHESQSRLFENLVGRSRAFVHYLYPTLKELFPAQLADVSAEEIWRAVNRAEPGLIRTEADELTYCLHVMVRYEIEKQLIGGTLEAKDVPAEWAKLYKEYLGIDVPNDRDGCLQDSHWSSGAFGYFPSYALGNATVPDAPQHGAGRGCGGQHRKGRAGPHHSLAARESAPVRRAVCPGGCGQERCGTFDPHYYTDYLTRKFSELYGL